MIFNNKSMSAKAKVRIYRTGARPIITYAGEIKADNTQAKITSDYKKHVGLIKNITRNQT